MAKTRSKTGNIIIKKEEQDYKPTMLLNGVTMSTRSKIAKRRSSKNRNRRLPAQQIKMEEDTDIKPLLQSTPKSSRLPKRQRISQEQINQFIDYVVNDKMGIRKAARRVKISYNAGRDYYKEYENNPEKKIPSPRNQSTHPQRVYTQQDIKNLIAYIEDDKMTISKASSKVNMTFSSGYHYYNKYLQDPNHNIPIPHFYQTHTQDQKDEFIGYVVNDKMNMKEASKKAKIAYDAGIRYYHKYFDIQNPDIATPSHITSSRRPTQKQIKELVGYVVDDKMTITAASRKSNVSIGAARKHYQQYLRDNNMVLPLPKNKTYTQDQKNEFIGYVVNDKMTIKAASKKANMKYYTAYGCYHRYLKDPKHDAPTRRRSVLKNE